MPHRGSSFSLASLCLLRMPHMCQFVIHFSISVPFHYFFFLLTKHSIWCSHISHCVLHTYFSISRSHGTDYVLYFYVLLLAVLSPFSFCFSIFFFFFQSLHHNRGFDLYIRFMYIQVSFVVVVVVRSQFTFFFFPSCFFFCIISFFRNLTHGGMEDYCHVFDHVSRRS